MAKRYRIEKAPPGKQAQCPECSEATTIAVWDEGSKAWRCWECAVKQRIVR